MLLPSVLPEPANSRPTSRQPFSGLKGTTSATSNAKPQNNEAQHFAIYRDENSAPEDIPAGWDVLDSKREKSKENDVQARPWTFGERMPMTPQPESGTLRIEVFRDGVCSVLVLELELTSH